MTSLVIYKLFPGEQRNLKIDFTNEAGKSGTSVSSATWTRETGTAVTLSTETLASNIAQVLLVASSTQEGCVMLSCAATMANSEILTEYVKVIVEEPEC